VARGGQRGREIGRGLGQARAERGVGPAAVVVGGPLADDGAEVGLREWNDPVEALAAERSRRSRVRSTMFDLERGTREVGSHLRFSILEV
jgi:hypothetical protein